MYQYVCKLVVILRFLRCLLEALLLSRRHYFLSNLPREIKRILVDLTTV